MKILSNPNQLKSELKRLMKNYQFYKWAVAWASSAHEHFELLKRYENRIQKIIVGTHFYQTDPDFIKGFQNNENVMVVDSTGGVFHPKIYLFENDDNKWECIIGSPNFTNAAFNGNKEAAVLISDSDKESNEAHEEIKKIIEEYWENSIRMDENKLENYRNMWESKRNLIKKLSGEYDSKPQKVKSPLDSKILCLSWEDYVRQIKENDVHGLDERLYVLDFAEEMLKSSSFKDLSTHERKRIAGLIQDDDADWRFFGSMVGAGYFKQAISNNNSYISDALDTIPSRGVILKENYSEFIRIFNQAFPRKYVAASTRLLAMKRPDYFICVDSKNRRELCKNFGIAQNINQDNYWDRIIERIIDSVWWNSNEPVDEKEKEIWNYRAAFLDSIFYSD